MTSVRFGEGDQEGAEETGQLGAVPLGQVVEQRPLGVQQGAEGAVDAGPALRREADDDAATVVRVWIPLHEPPRGQPVHAVGHRAAGHQRLAQQAAGRQLVRRPGTAQGREDVELPQLDLVRGEGVPAGLVEVPGQAGDPAEDGDGREVEVRPLARPGLAEVVDVVAHAGSLAFAKNLDIKRLEDDSRALHSWDPDRYLTYADERGRPFVELVTRIGAASPTSVVDLGCGPGNLTALLVERWPDAHVAGLDSSDEMIAKARETTPAVAFDVADLRDWVTSEGEPVDVLVSNATLQWVPGHLDLLPALAGRVPPGGWLAFQVPGNFGEPSHTL